VFRDGIGDAVFWAMIPCRAAGKCSGNATTAEFIALAEQLSGW
jgi:hypothetical protein